VALLLLDMNYINGMCMYLSSKDPDDYDYDYVGQVYSLQIHKQIETRKTLAVAPKAISENPPWNTQSMDARKRNDFRIMF
jgi:hypothetical protein